jgi:hypothetical protein
MESVGGTLHSKIAKVSAGLFGVGLIGGAAYCIAKSASIESVAPDEMFRRLRRASTTTIGAKLTEQFPFLTETEIVACRTAGSATTSGGQEFTFANISCEKEFQKKVVEYCTDQEVLKSRFMAIGIVLLIIAVIIIGTISISSVTKEAAAEPEEGSEPKIAKSAPMTVVIIGLASLAMFGLAGFLLFNRIKLDPFKSEIVKKIYEDFRPQGSDTSPLATDERIDYHLKSDPFTRNNTFPNGRNFYENVRSCGRVKLSGTSYVRIDTPAEEEASLEACRALEYGTYEEIISDYKNKEMFVVWGFVSFLASYILGSIAYSKYKTID